MEEIITNEAEILKYLIAGYYSIADEHKSSYSESICYKCKKKKSFRKILLIC